MSVVRRGVMKPVTPETTLRELGALELSEIKLSLMRSGVYVALLGEGPRCFTGSGASIAEAIDAAVQARAANAMTAFARA